MSVPSVADVKARAQTDLSDSALQDIIDAEAEYLARMAGSEAADAEVIYGGAQSTIVLRRRAASITQAIEYSDANLYDERVLDAADYKLVGNRTLVRLTSGPNPATWWAPVVRIDYVPVIDSALRKRAITDLVILRLAFDGYTRTRTGEWTGDQSDFDRRRDAIVREVQMAEGFAA